MAQSGHFAAEFQCLLSGVKRTSASLYNLIEVNCEVPGQFYFEVRIIGNRTERCPLLSLRQSDGIKISQY